MILGYSPDILLDTSKMLAQSYQRSLHFCPNTTPVSETMASTDSQAADFVLSVDR